MSEQGRDPLPVSQPSFERRDFLKLGAATVGGATAGASLTATAALAAARPLPRNPRTPAAMPTRNLGRTGYAVGVFSLGGQAAVEQPNNEAAAVAIVEKALDLGVNYIDTAARYGGDTPWSQTYIGQVMKRRRAEGFLATKTHDRTRDGSLKLLEQSLKLLQPTTSTSGRSTTCGRWTTWSRSSDPKGRSRRSRRRRSRASSGTSGSPAMPTIAKILDHLGLSTPEAENPPPLVQEVLRVAEHGDGRGVPADWD